MCQYYHRVKCFKLYLTPDSMGMHQCRQYALIIIIMAVFRFRLKSIVCANTKQSKGSYLRHIQVEFKAKQIFVCVYYVCVFCYQTDDGSRCMQYPKWALKFKYQCLESTECTYLSISQFAVTPHPQPNLSFFSQSNLLVVGTHFCFDQI